jgi:ribosomal protein S18 acetylase RimI-like enzyme
MKPIIRALTPKDKPRVMKILHSLPEFQPFEVVVAEELIDCYLQDSTESGYYIVVAEDDSAVAGYICYGQTPLTEGTWDIYWVAVARERQGQGIGGALLKYAEDKIREAQGRHVFVETSGKPEYDKTKRFYRDQGYEIICQIPDFYAPGDAKLILQKRL